VHSGAVSSGTLDPDDPGSSSDVSWRVAASSISLPRILACAGEFGFARIREKRRLSNRARYATRRTMKCEATKLFIHKRVI